MRRDPSWDLDEQFWWHRIRVDYRKRREREKSQERREREKSLEAVLFDSELMRP